MKRTFIIFTVIMLAALVLVGLNLASYTQKPKEADVEGSPNRSTFNSGGTGTLAFYSLLSESGRKVTRWQAEPSALRSKAANAPKVFVVVGDLRRRFTETEAGELFAWVESGGRLVVIDRHIGPELSRNYGGWNIELEPSSEFDIFKQDPTDATAMTRSVPAVRSVLPSLLASDVNAVQPSRFASSIVITRNEGDYADYRDVPGVEGANGPVVHYSGLGKRIVADVGYGSGKVVFLSDPYIVSNAGISLADNAQLAINLVKTDGVIAFDEYHQGFGASTNRFAQFFAGTPVVAIFFQLAALVGFVLFSRSRRFGRPVTEPEPDRRAKLEYISAMAELQQRAKAYDLAMENLYRDFRLRAARSVGADPSLVSTPDLAGSIAERVRDGHGDIFATLDQCEQVMYGSSATKHQFLDLVRKLRDIEIRLGIVRQPRKT